MKDLKLSKMHHLPTPVLLESEAFKHKVMSYPYYLYKNMSEQEKYNWTAEILRWKENFSIKQQIIDANLCVEVIF